MGESSDYKKDIEEKYKKIVLSASVSKEETIVIAQNYMIEKGMDTSYVISKPVVEELDFGNQCEVTFKATYGESIKKANIFGLLGVFKWWFRVYVDKKTGRITGIGEPDL